ncbi:MAG: MBOAT family O-acyltransferase [Deltaproteobacteria bacterium]
MQFNSYIFILAFLPFTLVGYYLLNRYGRNILAKVLLLVMSLVFCSYFNYKYLYIICASALINYVFSRLMLDPERSEPQKKWLLFAVISLNLLMLFYFKYFNFFIENVNVLFQSSFELKNIILPLGISFLTFQQIAYAVDSYRGETADYRFLDYAVFVAFFPRLVAGPIVLHGEIIPQLNEAKNHSINYGNFSYGILMFAVGLAKKVFIADLFANAVGWGFGSVGSLTALDAVIVMLSYTFQIYFDFSSYTDMALGIGLMFNIRLPINFNSPYKALSIQDFWKRWHLTLTRFLTKYLYLPLGGNRKGRGRTYVNIMIVFLVSGLWHGANWTFVLWGFMHGLASVLHRRFKAQWNQVHPVVQWFFTFLFVNIAWVFFRADSITQGFTLIKRMANLQAAGISPALLDCFDLPVITGLESLFKVSVNGLDALLFMAFAFVIVLCFKNLNEIKFKPTVFNAVCTVLLLVCSILSMSSISAFIYQKF